MQSHQSVASSGVAARKKIRTSADLAINSAQPAFASPLHVGRPNVGDRQRFLDLTGEMLDRAWLTNNGPMVVELEKRIATYLGVKHCVAVCNGTLGLEIAIRALGLTGEVIVPAFTFVATAHALHWQGITPVFADINPGTHQLDPVAVNEKITEKTSGILGVHVWGTPAPVEELQALAQQHNLRLLFDAAHAFGVSYKGRMIGNFGDVEVLSFHATKFFNTIEGGAAVTNDAQLAESMRLMRNFGFAGLDDVVSAGTNAKMTEVSAAMGLVNLDALDAVVTANRRNYTAYREKFAGLPGLSILPIGSTEQANYQYVVLEVASNCPLGRDRIIEVLHAENVLARKYFWPGCHRMQPYLELFPDCGVSLPATNAVADRVIVMPTGPTVDVADIQLIAEIVKVSLDYP